MEIWNPDTGTLSTIASLLPQESSSSSPLSKFTMVSIKNNTEILIIGGNLGGSYLSGANYKHILLVAYLLQKIYFNQIHCIC